MYLSSLQQFILLKVLERRERVERKIFRVFYKTKKVKEKYQEEIITKSLMSLIDRELLVGYGKRTPHKWFITHVRLTRKGIKHGQILLEEKQRKLPLR
ncbi:MAG: hypothetical protein HY980_01455 [Candidatus Magasanikbacteria bacterium]|nr:hypothetical protein [Candidatus Magasanikbacteria bacterium]